MIAPTAEDKEKGQESLSGDDFTLSGKAFKDFYVLEELEYPFSDTWLWTEDATFHLWVTLRAIYIRFFTTYTGNAFRLLISSLKISKQWFLYLCMT